jgi:hypothetical protein
MLAYLRVLPLAVIGAVLLGSGCSTRELIPNGQIGGVGGTGGTGTVGAGGAVGTGGAGGAGTGAGGQAAGGGRPTDATVIVPTDAGATGCVRAAILLPWKGAASGSPITLGRLDVVTAGEAIAVANRQEKQLDVRTYLPDGAVVGGFQFGADTQFLPYRDGNFLLVTRTTAGDFAATALQPDLVRGTRLATAVATATEHMLAAVVAGAEVVLITDEHFVNVTTGLTVTWSALLGADDRFKSSRVVGIASQTDHVLLARAVDGGLRVDRMGPDGANAGALVTPAFFGSAGSGEVNAVPFGSGLLLFDGNPVRLSQIGFDLSHRVLGENTQLRTFSAVRPDVAAVAPAGGRLIAFWLTIFPETDSTNIDASHALYACELDPAAPATCLRTARIANLALDGPDAVDPVAAAVLPTGDAFAVAHTDNGGNTWLTIADLDCASP